MMTISLVFINDELYLISCCHNAVALFQLLTSKVIAVFDDDVITVLASGMTIKLSVVHVTTYYFKFDMVTMVII